MSTGEPLSGRRYRSVDPSPVDTVDQWMASALRLLNSSPLFRLVFFAWVVLHHAYVFMVFFYHHLPHIGGSAPPRLRGGGRAAVDALG